MTTESSRPVTLLEAMLSFWRRAAEGKDRRSITDEERERLDAADPGGESLYYSFGNCPIFRDSDGTPYVWPAWSHAMTWPLFRGWQDSVAALVGEYDRGQLSQFDGLPQHLEGARRRLDELQPHLPLFLDHMRNGPGLPAEWTEGSNPRVEAVIDDADCEPRVLPDLHKAIVDLLGHTDRRLTREQIAGCPGPDKQLTPKESLWQRPIKSVCTTVRPISDAVRELIDWGLVEEVCGKGKGVALTDGGRVL